MKIRVLDRILVALAGLLMLAGVTGVALQMFFGKNVTGHISSLLENNTARVLIIIAMVLLFCLGVYCLLLLFRHRGRKEKFVLQRTDNGELAISLKALESMIQKCLEPHKELSAQSVHLENQKGGLIVRIRGSVAGGVSIPLTVDALQQQIKQYVTACSGVEVKDIRVQVETSGPDAKDAVFAIDPPVTPALLNAAEKAEAGKRAEKPEAAPMTPDEIEKVLAEVPPPNPSEAEESAVPVPVPAAAAAAAEMLRNEAPPEEDDRPIHQRLFSSPEEPCVMPMPPKPAEKADIQAANDKPESTAFTEKEKPSVSAEQEIPELPAEEDGKKTAEELVKTAEAADHDESSKGSEA